MKKKKKNESITLNEAELLAFNRAKQDLVDTTILVHPQSGALLCLLVGASDFSLGEVLQQLVDNTWQPIAFFSKAGRDPVQHVRSRVPSCLS